MKNVLAVSYLFTSTFIILTATPANAQDESDIKIFTSGRVGMTHSSDLPAPGEFNFAIGHRFGEIDGGFYDMFGLDLATIRLGFDYGLTDRFAVGIGRSTWEKTYDIYLKTAILKQKENGFPFSLTGLLTWSIATMRNLYPAENDGFMDRSSMSFQVMMARKQGIFSFQVSPSVFRNNFEIRENEPLVLYSVPVTGSLKITNRIAFSVQYIPVFNKPPYLSENPLSLGFDIETSGHQFQLLFSNTIGMFEKSVLTDTNGHWGEGKIYFGFNLVRVFYLK